MPDQALRTPAENAKLRQERYAQSEKGKARRKQHRTENAEKVSQQKKQSYEKNKEHYSKKNQEWHKKNPEASKKIKQTYIEKHREELRARSKAYYSKPAIKQAAKYAHVRRTYDLTPEQFNNLLAEQANLCKICGQPDTSKRGVLHVDHCHKTGRVRGLLCFKCNIALGKFKDDPQLLRNALAYLEEAEGG